MIPVRFGKLDIELLDFAIHLSEVLENVWFPIVLIFEWLVCSLLRLLGLAARSSRRIIPYHLFLS